MKNIKKILIGCFISAVISSGLSACATQPDPEVVCSSQWISKRTNAAMSEFERDARPVMKTLRKSGNALQAGNFNGLRTAQLLTAISSMIDKMQNSRALKDVQTLGKTCNDPDLLLNTFSNFMQEQGVPQPAIDMLESARGLLSNDS